MLSLALSAFLVSAASTMLKYYRSSMFRWTRRPLICCVNGRSFIDCPSGCRSSLNCGRTASWSSVSVSMRWWSRSGRLCLQTECLQNDSSPWLERPCLVVVPMSMDLKNWLDLYGQTVSVQMDWLISPNKLAKERATKPSTAEADAKSAADRKEPKYKLLALTHTIIQVASEQSNQFSTSSCSQRVSACTRLARNCFLVSTLLADN